MEAIQEAIRRALKKGDAGDRVFREKVYRQAFAALDRSLQGRSDFSAEEKQRQRKQVKGVIVGIEREFRRSSDTPSAPPLEEQPAAGTSADDFLPGVEREDKLNVTESFERGWGRASEPLALMGSGARRRSFGRLFVFTVLTAAVAVGGWWVYQAGPWQPGISPSVGEDSNPGNQPSARLAVGTQAANSEWIAVFSPSDPTTVTAPAGASVEVLEGTEGAFLRIGATETPVSFDVGQGVLEHLAGRRAVFSLTVRAAEEDEGQISISCDFGSLGGCGRMRYVVGPQPAEYLFEVELPAQQVRSGGTIAIVPDVEGRGRMLDVFSLRAAVARD